MDAPRGVAHSSSPDGKGEGEATGSGLERAGDAGLVPQVSVVPCEGGEAFAHEKHPCLSRVALESNTTTTTVRGSTQHNNTANNNNNNNDNYCYTISGQSNFSKLSNNKDLRTRLVCCSLERAVTMAACLRSRPLNFHFPLSLMDFHLVVERSSWCDLALSPFCFVPLWFVPARAFFRLSCCFRAPSLYWGGLLFALYVYLVAVSPTSMRETSGEVFPSCVGLKAVPL